ncbi:MAG: S9 family peptidase [Gammaproteobacteria bacterium]|nr:S9 family peptidase [Gammaproteobacteria bacterium]MDH5630096.1 S9 family peptidase [Gammaproteobacteria bacterium]
MKYVKPYGSWLSKLSADELSKKSKRYGHLVLDKNDLYWLELRAEEKGRFVLMVCRNHGKPEEVLPKDISVHSKVHEYGGADYTVIDGKVFFSNVKDNRIYIFHDDKLEPLTPIVDEQEDRYTDFQLSPCHKFLIAVRESHRNGSVVNELIAIDCDNKTVSVLHSGYDFYSFPRLSKQGHRLCWTCWNQPDMPWDNAELWLADFHANGTIDGIHKVTGGGDTSVFQPEWSGDGVLHYISDKNNWSNIYSHKDGVLNALAPTDRDFAVPQWVFGLGTYVINDDDSLYALYFENGEQHLCHIDEQSGLFEPIDLPFRYFESALRGNGKSLYFIAASPTSSVGVYHYDIEKNIYTRLTETVDFPLDSTEISVAQSISFSSANDRESYAFYYPPLSDQYQAEEGDLPPLIVISHGGPTGNTNNSLDPNIQFWTNRGFAVVDVNYGGSTGYGKAYRNCLLGQWGIVDVEDCIAAAQYLVSEKLADPDRLLIRGGSAGGFTTLSALTFHDVFAAGMSRYGVADLESLASDSHKFEARYLDKVVGGYSPDDVEAVKLYQSRSPIHHTDKLSCPILLLQGTEDKVVPPNQAEKMVEALEAKQLPYAYILFEGEGHGFRKSETIIQAFNAELYFYRKVLGIESEEQIPKVKINNLS